METPNWRGESLSFSVNTEFISPLKPHGRVFANVPTVTDQQTKAALLINLRGQAGVLGTAVGMPEHVFFPLLLRGGGLRLGLLGGGCFASQEDIPVMVS